MDFVQDYRPKVVPTASNPFIGLRPTNLDQESNLRLVKIGERVVNLVVRVLSPSVLFDRRSYRKGVRDFMHVTSLPTLDHSSKMCQPKVGSKGWR